MKKIILILTILTSSASFADLDKVLKRASFRKFTTDGCSAYPDGYIPFLTNEWLHCCVAHDINYWPGGTKRQRESADLKLNSCVAQATSETHGEIMEVGVIIGGPPHQLVPWRWNYGWSLSHYTYQALSVKEKAIIYQDYSSVMPALKQIKHRLNYEQKNYIITHYLEQRMKLQSELAISPNVNDQVEDSLRKEIEEFISDESHIEETRRVDRILDYAARIKKKL